MFSPTLKESFGHPHEKHYQKRQKCIYTLVIPSLMPIPVALTTTGTKLKTNRFFCFLILNVPLVEPLLTPVLERVKQVSSELMSYKNSDEHTISVIVTAILNTNLIDSHSSKTERLSATIIHSSNSNMI